MTSRPRSDIVLGMKPITRAQREKEAGRVCLTVWIPAEDHLEVLELSRVTGVSVSGVVRSMIRKGNMLYRVMPFAIESLRDGGWD